MVAACRPIQVSRLLIRTSALTDLTGTNFSEKRAPLRLAVLHRDDGRMQFGDALHDRKPEPGAAVLAAVAPPEAAEDELAFVVA